MSITPRGDATKRWLSSLSLPVGTNNTTTANKEEEKEKLSTLLKKDSGTNLNKTVPSSTFNSIPKETKPVEKKVEVKETPVVPVEEKTEKSPVDSVNKPRVPSLSLKQAPLIEQNNSKQEEEEVVPPQTEEKAKEEPKVEEKKEVEETPAETKAEETKEQVRETPVETKAEETKEEVKETPEDTKAEEVKKEEVNETPAETKAEETKEEVKETPIETKEFVEEKKEETVVQNVVAEEQKPEERSEEISKEEKKEELIDALTTETKSEEDKKEEVSTEVNQVNASQTNTTPAPSSGEEEKEVTNSEEKKEDNEGKKEESILDKYKSFTLGDIESNWDFSNHFVSWSAEIFMIHSILRNMSHSIEKNGRTVTPDQVDAFRTFFNTYYNVLEVHHHGEDTILFKQFNQYIDYGRYTEEHADIESKLKALKESVLNNPFDGEQVSQRSKDLNESLFPHLEEEEKSLLPVHTAEKVPLSVMVNVMEEFTKEIQEFVGKSGGPFHVFPIMYSFIDPRLRPIFPIRFPPDLRAQMVKPLSKPLSHLQWAMYPLPVEEQKEITEEKMESTDKKEESQAIPSVVVNSSDSTSVDHDEQSLKKIRPELIESLKAEDGKENSGTGSKRNSKNNKRVSWAPKSAEEISAQIKAEGENLDNKDEKKEEKKEINPDDVKEGYLDRKKAGGKGWEPVFIIVDIEKHCGTVQQHAESKEILERLELTNAQIYHNVERKGKPAPFLFNVRTTKGDYLFQAHSEKEKHEWVKVFNRGCVESTQSPGVNRAANYLGRVKQGSSFGVGSRLPPSQETGIEVKPTSPEITRSESDDDMSIPLSTTKREEVSNGKEEIKEVETKEEVKPEEVKKEEPKEIKPAEEIKKEEVKHAEVKEEPKKEEPKKEEPKKEEPKEEPKKEELKRGKEEITNGKEEVLMKSSSAGAASPKISASLRGKEKEDKKGYRRNAKSVIYKNPPDLSPQEGSGPEDPPNAMQLPRLPPTAKQLREEKKQKEKEEKRKQKEEKKRQKEEKEKKKKEEKEKKAAAKQAKKLEEAQNKAARRSSILPGFLAKRSSVLPKGDENPRASVIPENKTEEKKEEKKEEAKKEEITVAPEPNAS